MDMILFHSNKKTNIFNGQIVFFYLHGEPGAFSRFLPTLPYPFVGGDNSPPISTHSPPAAIAMTNIGNGNRIALGARDSRDSLDYMTAPTVVRPQPQLPSSASIAAGGHLPNGTPSTLSPLRIRVSSPNRINSDLTSVSTHFYYYYFIFSKKSILSISLLYFFLSIK